MSYIPATVSGIETHTVGGLMETHDRTFLCLLLIALASLCVEPLAVAQTTLLPPQGLHLTDTPNDNGSGVCLIWDVSPNATKAHEYVIFSSTSAEGPFHEIKRIPATLSLKSDYPEFFGFSKTHKNFHCASLLYPLKSDTREPIPTWYRLAITDGTDLVFASDTVTGIPTEEWTAWNKTNNFILMLVLFAAIGYYIQRARTNPNLF
ncbi:MAG TPA: hypothetical protein PKH07_10130, partial [bacterium]|nr:hypothetical protein [bacterium]